MNFYFRKCFNLQSHRGGRNLYRVPFFFVWILSWYQLWHSKWSPIFSGKTKEPECLDFKSFQAPTEQGMRESNSHQRFWRPLSYHLTNPLHFISFLFYYLLHKNDVLLRHFFGTSCTFKTSYRFRLQTFWSSPRSISNSQLHTLPCFHLCPIYLVIFKGSYSLT